MTDHPSRETVDSGQLIGDSGAAVEAGSQGGLLYVSNPARLGAMLPRYVVGLRDELVPAWGADTAGSLALACPVDYGSDAEDRPIRRQLHSRVRAKLEHAPPSVRRSWVDVADSPGSERTYSSWSGYLEDFFAQHADLIQQLGIGGDRIQATLAFIRAYPFVAEGRFLHGDVSVRNVAIFGYQPMTVGLFDPNPVSGDPSWDIAPMVNNVAYNELHQRREDVSSEVLGRDRELLDGFWESYPGGVAEESLLTAQLVQAVLQAEVRKERLRHDQADTVDVDVVYEFIRAAVDRAAA